MKKILFALFAACSLTAAADDFNYLEVENKNGTTLDIALANLRKVTFAAGNMVVETSEGETTSVALDELARLYFSASPTPVTGVKAEAKTGIVGVYTLDGRQLKTSQADVLPGGVYIVKKADGTSVKIAR
ncbi:MAG: hypothetical protein HUK01_06965 [Bacteroidaceae bacterium]|nr:hypothetical protein [Bacteroidaceae bacterium]